MEWNNNVCDTRGRDEGIRNRPAALFSLSLRDLRQHLRSLIEGSVIKWFVTKRKVTGTRTKEGEEEDGHWRWSSSNWIENCFRCPRGYLQFLRCCCPSLVPTAATEFDGYITIESWSIYLHRVRDWRKKHVEKTRHDWSVNCYLTRLYIYMFEVIIVWEKKNFPLKYTREKYRINKTLLLFKTFLRFERLTSPRFVIFLETKISSSINTINYPWLIHRAFDLSRHLFRSKKNLDTINS